MGAYMLPRLVILGVLLSLSVWLPVYCSRFVLICIPCTAVLLKATPGSIFRVDDYTLRRCHDSLIIFIEVFLGWFEYLLSAKY